MKKLIKASIFILIGLLLSCSAPAQKHTKVIVGAENLDEYIELLKNKNVGLVVNHTSTIGETHLVDFLISQKINIVRIFAPEHGFRGEASAGEKINNSIDEKTGKPIISLYGKNKKPSVDQLIDLDIVVFDIQDVGVRFYTYISTLNYVMIACAENDKKLIVLDRPNPNADYVAGPVLDMKFNSFVGVNPIPVVYGLTIGELALMNNGEYWLGNKLQCDLKVVKCKNYNHKTVYNLPYKPSPNLPNYKAVRLYPSICLFEPTKISVGRGTDKQFQVIGGPDKALGSYIFTPVDKPGAMDPVNENIICYGKDLSEENEMTFGFNLNYLVEYYSNFKNKASFFTNKSFFNLLIGNDWVITDIEKGMSASQIELKWQKDLDTFKEKRKKYLIYKD